MKKNFCMLSISIVSHGQWQLVRHLLSDIRNLNIKSYEIIITLNIIEEVDYVEFNDMPINYIINDIKKGFGANHNHAFLNSVGQYFLVLNPDVRIKEMDIEKFIEYFSDVEVGVVAPLAFDKYDKIQDNIRRYPNIFTPFKRFFTKNIVIDYEIKKEVFAVDWVSGLFMLFSRRAFNAVNGFDSNRFFMYYEDVDICRRLKKMHFKILCIPFAKVTHQAQKTSHHNYRYLFWHIKSAFRYFTNF